MCKLLTDRVGRGIESLQEYLSVNKDHQDYGDFHPFKEVRLIPDGIEFTMLSHHVVIRTKHYTALKSSSLRTFLKEINLKTGEMEYRHIPTMDIVVSLEKDGAYFLTPQKIWNDRREQEFEVKKLRKFGNDYTQALANYLDAHERAEWNSLFAELLEKATT